MELIVSTAAASILVLGLSSSMWIALRATESSNTPAQTSVAGLNLLTDLSTELEYTLTISEQTATAITVTVPDRADIDTNPEAIRYAWSGTAGDPITRQYNGGTVSNIIDDVHAFVVEYFQPSSSVEYLTLRVQIGSSAQGLVETSVELVNRP